MPPADAHWFRARPHRSFRLRRPLPGETGPWVIVKQVKPGVRVRAEVELSVGVAPADDEATARSLFKQVARHDVARRVIAQVGLAFAEPEGRA